MSIKEIQERHENVDHFAFLSDKNEYGYAAHKDRGELLDALREIGESETDLVGVLEQTLLAVPKEGNLALRQAAINAINYHKAILDKLGE
jgi:hypothetical protein